VKKDNRQDLYHRQLDTILRFSTLINSSLNIEGVLDIAMKWAEEFMFAEASSVYELDENHNELFIRLARGEKKDPIKGIKLKVGEGIAGWVVESGQPMVIQDVTKEKRFSDKFDKLTGFKTNSMICVPLIQRDRPIGALQVLNKKSNEPFVLADLELLISMAPLIVVAMENAKLYQRLEKKFELTEQELKRTQEKLIRSERLMAMGHLVQGIAHEVRNPNMTIGGFARRIKKEVTHNSKLLKYIDVILDESNRLERLVKQIGEFAEVQSASLILDQIEPIVDDVFIRFKPLANQQGVLFEDIIKGDIPPIKMDSSQILTALSNMVENALESMPEGGRLSVKVTLENNDMVIILRDTGCGVAQEQLDSIYDPFVTSKTSGAGLGLTMVHQIIMNHHGEINIRSQLDKGTIVTIRIPVHVGCENGR